MVRSCYSWIDTPALLIDREIMESNLRWMQNNANRWGVKLRPHTKTHKMPELAKLQQEFGAAGITVAKVGEAEVMAAHGLTDIFIANEIVGAEKWRRLAALTRKARISFGVDSPQAIHGIESIFSLETAIATVRIEIETGENRSGITSEAMFDAVLEAISQSPHVELEGVFSHEGHTYSAPDPDTCRRQLEDAQKLTLYYAERARAAGFPIEIVSIGSTPSLIHCDGLLDGITEIRPGTYIFMDAGQSNCLGSYDRCAATVLTTIISKPTADRLIGDAGAKALTAQSRGVGLCQTEGKGIVKCSKIPVTNVYDEHTILYSEELHKELFIGDKIEIIPNHICPVVNLFDRAYLVSCGDVVRELDIACRGKTR